MRAAALINPTLCILCGNFVDKYWHTCAYGLCTYIYTYLHMYSWSTNIFSLENIQPMVLILSCSRPVVKMA